MPRACVIGEMREAADEVFFPWFLSGSRIVTILGAPNSGKTRKAVALMVETISRRYYRLPDEFRFRYANAPAIVDELARLKYDKESNLNVVLRAAGMLILDNLHAVSAREILRTLQLITFRADDALSTIITCDAASFAALGKADASFAQKCADGLMLST
jgi:DNA replication protein DnaC